jgi:hypothetical protein
MIARDLDVASIDARLAEAAGSGEPVEVVLVLRGSVRRARGSSRWRLRVPGGRVLTFAAEWVVAATPAGRRPR